VQTPWYTNAVFYALDVDRFVDSNGDGIGDFPGATSKLEYLADLGVTCLWLLPIHPAPNRDNGYDIKNYYDVDPRLGTLDDFIHFLHRAGEYGIRVIMDLVVNHTSDEHPWFQAARRDPGSLYRDFYTWSDAPPPTPLDKGNIFPDQETSVWTYDEIAGAYYYHRFYHFQPELNFHNPIVRDEVKKVLDFWLSFGIAGFRIDAASHVIESIGEEGYSHDERHDILKEIRAHVSGRKENAVLIGEADVEPEKMVAYFGDGDELNMLFNFALNNHVYLAMARQDARPVIEILRQLPAIPNNTQWANFLRNLDELDLEQLSDEEREEVLEAFAPDENMRIYGRGIRRRLAPMLGNDLKRIRLAFSLLFALPGAPVIVYGDEIGMGDDLSLEERRAVRTVMQWSKERNAGFSTAPANRLLLPVISEGDFAYRNVNVAAQQEKRDSLWHFIRKLIYLRRDCPEIGTGNWHIMDVGLNEVLALRCQWKAGIVLTLHNFSAKPRAVDLDMHDQRGRRMQNLFDGHAEQIGQQGNYHVDLEPYECRWYRVTGERAVESRGEVA